MLNIRNAILRLRNFLSQWRKADVTFIPNPNKDHLFPSNYRPISLLPDMSKVAERIILARIREHTNVIHVLSDEQFAYSISHSTEPQVLRLVESVTKGFNRNQVTAAVMLDVAKAFDRVWHDGLLVKMQDLGYPASILRMLRTCIRRRKVPAKIDGELSASTTFLFNIYTSDLPPIEHTSLAFYTDSTVIIVQSIQAEQAKHYLQEALSNLEDWLNRLKVAVNPEKTNAILFSMRCSQMPVAQVILHEVAVRWVDQVKYLGVTLGSRLSWKKHIDAVANKVKLVRVKLYPLLCSGSTLSLKNKVLLVKTVT